MDKLPAMPPVPDTVQAMVDEVRRIAVVTNHEDALLRAAALLLSLQAELEQARNLLRGAQTHLLDGDNSIWRSQVDEFVMKADGRYTALRESQP